MFKKESGVIEKVKYKNSSVNLDESWIVEASCPFVDVYVYLLRLQPYVDYLYIHGVEYTGWLEPFKV